MGEKVLVTGGAGFIGSHLVDNLVSQGHEVTVIDDLSGGFEGNVNKKAEFVKGSIVDYALVDKLVEGKKYVYHLAAYAAEGLSPFIRRYNYLNNLIGSVNLINSAIKHGVNTFVFTSSMAVYGSGNPPFDEKDKPNPIDPYGVAKAAVEKDLEIAHNMHGLNYVIFRPHNVYGERQFLGDPYRNVIGIFMNRIMKGLPPLIYGDGEQTRAFSYVGDVAPCIAKAPFTESAKNQIINIGATRPYTLKELANMVVEVMGGNVSPVHVAPRHEVKHAHCTTEKSEKLLGFKDTISLRAGLSKMAAWAKGKGPMEPIIWDSYEITHNIPEYWKTLSGEFPEASFRIDVKEAMKDLFTSSNLTGSKPEGSSRIGADNLPTNQ